MRSYLDEIEKLANQFERKKITIGEFEKRKTELLNEQKNKLAQEPKSQTVYVLLAFLLGLIGVHNFYAGYKKRGIAQIFLTLLTPVTLFLSLFINYVWIVINILKIEKDAQGVPFKKNVWVKNAFAILLVIQITLYSLFFVGGFISGYLESSARHQAERIQKYALLVAEKTIEEGLFENKECAKIIAPNRNLKKIKFKCIALPMPSDNGALIYLDELSDEVLENLETLIPDAERNGSEFLIPYVKGE